VFSGKLFTEPFNIMHAGLALDQPTIGKWLFWFAVMAVSSLPYVALLGWLADRKARAGRLAFAISVSVLGVFLLCILSGPMCLLIQYVCSMGSTPRRIYGLVYGVVGGLLVIGLVAWSLRNPDRKESEGAPPLNGGAAMPSGNSGAAIGELIVALSGGWHTSHGFNVWSAGTT
jgi:hypothetical protein